jgi:hypothetical protein
VGQGQNDSQVATSQQAMESGRCKTQCGIGSAIYRYALAYNFFNSFFIAKSQNVVLQLAKETGNIDLFELKEELSYNLQMCDQLTYNNAFVYFQPGSGKFNINEPKQLAIAAMRQIQEAIDLSNE